MKKRLLLIATLVVGLLAPAVIADAADNVVDSPGGGTISTHCSTTGWAAGGTAGSIDVYTNVVKVGRKVTFLALSATASFHTSDGTLKFNHFLVTWVRLDNGKTGSTTSTGGRVTPTGGALAGGIQVIAYWDIPNTTFKTNCSVGDA
jgi:opacity protein-like surface antigen